MKFSSISVPVVPSLSQAQIEKEATAFLKIVSPKTLDIAGPTPVLEIFENKMDLFDFDIVVGKNIKGLPGMTDVTHRYIQISISTYKKLEKDFPHARFTVAHEFGHAYLHGRSPSRPLFSKRNQLRPFEDPEWQANTFAASLLMPQKTMWLLFLKKAMTVENVMETYAVSWSAATRRVLKLSSLFQNYQRGIYE
jgi:Zn-dependent peptidase ImmA (M78 family)